MNLQEQKCQQQPIAVSCFTATAKQKVVSDICDYFREKLAQIDEVAGVDGLGLMIGVRLKTKKAADILVQCAQRGLLILTAKEKLRFLPPLNISDENIKTGMAILKDILDN